MKVNLVEYQMSYTSQILGKFAWRMSEELDKLGIKHAITDTPDPSYDVNHHIIYSSYRHVDSVNTLMITHVDSKKKFVQVEDGMKTADRGICMSQQMVDELVEKGIDARKLTYVTPAHDNTFIPIPVTILTNVYEDGRKREYMLAELAKHIDPSRFLFRIMGQNWDIDTLKKLGLTIEYHPAFEREVQDRFLRDSKYFLYFGLEQGSMALLDAMRAGVKTIAPWDGFHRHSGVDYPFLTQEELNAIFAKIQEPALPDWTWENYTKKHVAIWEGLLKNRQSHADHP